MDEFLDRIAYVTALAVPADAVLAVKVNTFAITPEQAEMLKQQIAEVLPGREILVLGKDVDLVVVRNVA